MALLLSSAALILSFLLSSASAQTNIIGSYNTTAEKDWNNFVEEAAKGTGGTTINMDEFLTRVNNNLNNGGDEGGADPDLIEQVQNLDDRKNVPSAPTSNSSKSDSEIPPPAAAKMTATANGDSLASEKAALN